MDEMESLSHTKVQIPCGVHPQVPAKDVVPGTPPKYALSEVVASGQKRDPPGAGVRRAGAKFCGTAFWARGYYVSTIGRDEAVIRDYIRRQEEEDKRFDQLGHPEVAPNRRGRVSDPA